MKKILLMKHAIFILSFFFSIVSFAQKPIITVTAPDDDIDFQFYIGNKEYSEGPDTSCTVKTLAEGKHKFTITFENDTIADVIRNYKIKQGFTYTFEIKPKSKLMKFGGETGRKVSENDYNDDKLADFYGVEITKIKN